MPSIEIICEGQERPENFEDMPFAVIASTDLVSHRVHVSLFQKEFNKMQGCIYHLGNPILKEDPDRGFFFAHELLTKESMYGED